eukprot:scaffold579_cov546-Prasinococcus_capsulatus_cf.AAC.1
MYYYCSSPCGPPPQVREGALARREQPGGRARSDRARVLRMASQTGGGARSRQDPARALWGRPKGAFGAL